MGLLCVACTCGFSDKLIRTRLEHCGYRDSLAIPITRGKERSKKILDTIPQHPELLMLRTHLDNSSKFAVVIGYNDAACRWVDLANGKAVQNNIDLEYIVADFT